MKERVIKDKKELAKLLLVCQALKQVKISVPNVLYADKSADAFNLIWYGGIPLTEIKGEFEKKGVDIK